MKPTHHLTLLALCLSMSASVTLATAQSPADKTGPARKMTTDDDTKGKPSTPEPGAATTATVDEKRVVIEEQAAAIDAAAAKPKPGTLAEVISKSVTFSTLTKALMSTGLEATFAAKGAYTVFAPTDEAFDKLPAGTLGKLMLPENKEKLRSLLLYHVVPGVMMASDLKEGEVKTMNGEKVKIEVADGKVEVNDSKVYSTDVPATNGVMHSVGTVLIPKSLDNFAGLEK